MKLTGLLLVLLSAATFGTSGSFADSLLATGWTPGAAVTARICAAAVVLTAPALLLARGRWSAVRGEAPCPLPAEETLAVAHAGDRILQALADRAGRERDGRRAQ
mgnify:CR=1 FL=1